MEQHRTLYNTQLSCSLLNYYPADFSEILGEGQEVTACALCKFSEKSDKPGCLESSVNRLVSRPYSGRPKCHLTVDGDCSIIHTRIICLLRQCHRPKMPPVGGSPYCRSGLMIPVWMILTKGKNSGHLRFPHQVAFVVHGTAGVGRWAWWGLY